MCNNMDAENIAKLLKDFDENYRKTSETAHQMICSQKIPILSQLFGDLTSKVLWKILGLVYRWGVDTTEMSTMLCLLTDYVSQECGHLGMIEDTNSFLQKLSFVWNKCLIQVKKDCSKNVFKALFRNLLQYSDRFGKHGLSYIFADTLKFANQLKLAKQWSSVDPTDFVICTSPQLPTVSCVSNQTLRKIIQAGNSICSSNKENISSLQCWLSNETSTKGSVKQTVGLKRNGLSSTNTAAKIIKSDTALKDLIINNEARNCDLVASPASLKKRIKDTDKHHQLEEEGDASTARNACDMVKPKETRTASSAWSLDTLLEDKKQHDHEQSQKIPRVQKKLKFKKSISDQVRIKKSGFDSHCTKDYISYFRTPDLKVEKTFHCESAVGSTFLPADASGKKSAHHNCMQSLNRPLQFTNENDNSTIFGSNHYNSIHSSPALPSSMVVQDDSLWESASMSPTSSDASFKHLHSRSSSPLSWTLQDNSSDSLDSLRSSLSMSSDTSFKHTHFSPSSPLSSILHDDSLDSSDRLWSSLSLSPTSSDASFN